MKTAPLGAVFCYGDALRVGRGVLCRVGSRQGPARNRRKAARASTPFRCLPPARRTPLAAAIWLAFRAERTFSGHGHHKPLRTNVGSPPRASAWPTVSHVEWAVLPTTSPTATPTVRTISPALTLTRDIPQRCNTRSGLAPRPPLGNGCALKKRRPLNGSDPGVTSGPSSELAAPPLLTSYIRKTHIPGGPQRPRPGKRAVRREAVRWAGLPTLRDARRAERPRSGPRDRRRAPSRRRFGWRCAPKKCSTTLAGIKRPEQTPDRPRARQLGRRIVGNPHSLPSYAGFMTT
jgi:hypothetical protein